VNWKHFDLLVESTMTFARDVKREPVSDWPSSVRTAEEALADTPSPVLARAIISPMVWPESEGDEIRQRITNFKAHQQKIAREREDYYLETKARLLASPARREAQ
jgi:hypothetical protein